MFAREIIETFCVDKSCKFNGQHAAQGVCFHRPGGVDNSYLERVEKMAEEALTETRAIRKSRKMTTAQYIQCLESNYVCDQMNSEFSLDGLIRLRAENATLKLQASRQRK